MRWTWRRCLSLKISHHYCQVREKPRKKKPLRILTCILKGRYSVPDVCIICLEDLQPGFRLRQLPCEHLFHQPCIDEWICDRDTSCPLCSEKFYHLRRPRENSTTPSVRQGDEISGERRGSDSSRGKFKVLKAWCRNRRHD